MQEFNNPRGYFINKYIKIVYEGKSTDDRFTHDNIHYTNLD